MKKLITALFLIVSFCLHAQTYVKIPFNQRQVFTVSADSVFKSIDQGNVLELGTDIEISGGSGNYSFIWSSGSNVLGTSLVLNVSSVGEYVLNINDGSGCQTRVIYQVKVNTGIDNPESSQLSVYPLPASQFVFVRPLNGLVLKSVTLRNAVGEIIKTTFCNREIAEIIQFNLDDVQAGQYFLTCDFVDRKITRVIVKK